jgi:serine/threonine protein kinase
MSDREETRTESQGHAVGPSAGPAPLNAIGGPAFQVGEKLGRFTVRRLHGSGGLGEVWIAFDELLGREVAIKVLRTDRQSPRSHRQRFAQEAQIAARLEHPNIVPVYEPGMTPRGLPFYAMRFVPGQTLAHSIRQFYSQPATRHDALIEFRRLLKAFVGICHAIEFAHQNGVLHRDLKPSNVVWGEYGDAIVLDWGLAKRFGSVDTTTGEPIDRQQAESPAVDVSLASADRAQADTDRSDIEIRPTPIGSDDCRLTHTGQLIGTLPFMAPEQASGLPEQVDRKSDIYALGAILYVILTNRLPFTESDPAKLVASVLERSPTPPRAVRRAVPRALEAICLKAMARKKDDRYESPADLAADVERWLADEPVSSYREPWHVRARRWMKRHRTGAIVATTAAVSLLIVMLGFVAFSTLRATELRVRASETLTRAAELAEDDQEVRALDLLRQVEATLAASPFPGLANARQQVALARGQLEQRLERGPADARARLTNFQRLVAAAFSAPRGDELESKGRLLATIEQALDLYGVLRRDNWAAADELAWTNSAERDALEQDIQVLLSLYYETQHRASIRGSACAGIGAQLYASTDLSQLVPRVREMVTDGPAASAGIRVDDKLLAIDGRDTRALVQSDGRVDGLDGEPDSELTIVVLSAGEAIERTVRLRRDDQGRVGIADLAAVPQLTVLATDAGSASERAGIQPGDMILSVNGQPAEGEITIHQGDLDLNPHMSWFSLLDRAVDPHVTLMVWRPGNQRPKQVTVARDDQQIAAMRRANVLYVAHLIRLFRPAFVRAIELRDQRLLSSMGIEDKDAPLETHLETVYTKKYGWPSAIVRQAVALSDAPYPLFDQGFRRFTEGDRATAIRLFLRELQTHPQHAESYRQLAAAHALLKQHDSAIAAWSAYMALRPGWPHSYLQRGKAYLEIGLNDAARKDLELAIQLDAKLSEARDLLARLETGANKP